MRIAIGAAFLLLLQSSNGFTHPLTAHYKNSIFPAWAKQDPDDFLESVKAYVKQEEGVDPGGEDDPEDLKSAVKAAVKKASMMEKISDKAIPVRFVNFDKSNPLRQLVAYVPEGKNLLKIGDEAGIHIPRQCRSGLCGSCTADVKDPNWFEEGSRQGYQTIRTCQAGAMIPSGCEEMVVDLYRMLDEAPKEVVEAGGASAEEATLRVASPAMSNFEDGWEQDFAPDYKTGGKPAVISSPTPAYTLSGSSTTNAGGKKKLRRWVPHSASNIPPWEVIW